MKPPEQWAQEIELRCVADNRRPRIAVEADVIREAVNEGLKEAAMYAWARAKTYFDSRMGTHAEGQYDAALVLYEQIEALKIPEPK